MEVENTPSNIVQLIDINNLPDGDVKRKWWGGTDKAGVYHNGAEPIGVWASTLEELNQELERFKKMDQEDGLQSVEYGYISDSPEPHTQETSIRRLGFVLASTNRSELARQAQQIALAKK